MGRYTYIVCVLMSLGLLVSACDGYHKDFEPAQVAWAKQPGNKTLAVQLTGDDGLHQRLYCNVAEKAVMLLPDTKFYRNYLRVALSQIGFKEQLGRQAAPLARPVSFNAGCRLVFNNLPAGSWLLIARPQFYVHDGAEAQLGRNPQHNVAPPAFMWSALTLSSNAEVTAFHIEVDVSRLARKKHPHLHTHIRRHSKKRWREFHGAGSPNTQVEAWRPTLQDQQDLGLPVQDRTVVR